MIGFDGRMNDQAGEFAGLPAAAARQQVVDRLFSLGLLKGGTPTSTRSAIATAPATASSR